MIFLKQEIIRIQFILTNNAKFVYQCPVFDLNVDVKFEGLWETMNRKGGITISVRKQFNFIILIFSFKKSYRNRNSPMDFSSFSSRKAMMSNAKATT